MATYNGAQYVESQLESLRWQVRLPDVVVVSDDGSSDDTLERVRRFASAAPFPVRVVSTDQNAGVTKNFERAIRLCDTDLIFLADQDDIWLPMKVAKLEAALVRNPSAGLVFSDALIVDDNLNSLGATLWERIWFSQNERALMRSGRCLDVLLRRNVVQGSAMAFRSGLVDLILPIPALSPLVWMHDGWIALLVAAVAEVEIVPEPLILYRQHRSSQIGAPMERGLGRYWMRLARARRRGRVAVVEEWRQYREALVRLEHRSDVPAERRRALREKVRHLEARAQLPQRWVRRIPLVMTEVARGRYHRYSRGLKAVLHDIIM